MWNSSSTTVREVMKTLLNNIFVVKKYIMITISKQSVEDFILETMECILLILISLSNKLINFVKIFAYVKFAKITDAG